MQDQSKNVASADMEMSLNILEMLSCFHYFYSQLLIKLFRRLYGLSWGTCFYRRLRLFCETLGRN